jgi:signal transduction histidine kinase
VKLLIRPIIILFFLIQVNSLNAQYKVLIDSLKMHLKGASHEDRFKLLTDIGFEYRLSYPDSTIFYCKQAYDLGITIGIKSGLAKPLSFMGLAMAYKGENAAAYEYHLQAIEQANAEKDKIQLAYGYNNLGRLFFDQGDLQRAHLYFMDALQLMQETQDELGLSYVYRSLSNLYKSQNDLDKSLEASLMALEYRKKLGEPRPLLSAFSELALVYKDRNETNLSILNFTKADSIAESINDRISIAEINLGIAEMHLANNNYVTAKLNADEADEIIKLIGNQRLQLRSNLIMARLNFLQKKYSTAEFYTMELIRDAERANQLSYLRDAYQIQKQLEEAKGDVDKAILMENKYLILNERLQNIDLTRELERMEFRYTIERNEREKEVFLANEAQMNAELKQRKVVLYALSVIMLLISVMTILFWRVSRLRRIANKKLTEQSTYIKRQSEEIENQNERIAEQNKNLSKRNEELAHLNNEKDILMNIVAHDLKSPIHRISGLSDLINLSGDLSKEQTKYNKMIKEITGSSAELISDLLDVNALESEREKLRPVSTNMNTFIQERVRLFRSAAKEKEITFQLALNAPELITIDTYLLSRIIDNLISNAIKFSNNGSKVEIKVIEEANNLAISIKDYGLGFTDEDKSFLYQKFRKLSARPTAGESSNGLGLAIVKILTDRLNGSIELITEPGGGSEFILRFPILT